MTFAIEFMRLDKRFCPPAFNTIPEGSTPADELGAFLDTMYLIGVPIAQMSPGRYAVHLTDAEQLWSVRVVRVGDPGDTEEIIAAMVEGEVPAPDWSEAS